MRTIRIFFSKRDEAAYISHLDLQRVMARALRRSGLPVWYSQGFNPHIYISFALPLSLGQQSVAESMDCKTESEQEDFSAFIQPLNSALPRGIAVTAIAQPVHGAGEIAQAEYHLGFTMPKEQLEELVQRYNQSETAVIIRKTKRSEGPFNLKDVLPSLHLQAQSDHLPAIAALLPAGSGLNINPELLLGFLRDSLGLQQRPDYILRTRVLLQNGKVFC